MAPSQLVGVSASVNLPLHHKVQKFSGTGSPGWFQKKGSKTVVVCWLILVIIASKMPDGNNTVERDICMSLAIKLGNSFCYRVIAWNSVSCDNFTELILVYVTLDSDNV